MKTALFSLARALPIVAAIGVSAALVCEPAVAARSGAAHAGGGWHGGTGGWHGGAGYYHGGYCHWGHYGYGYWPYWGAVGLGIGIGAIGYYGYYGGYYPPYYDAYYYDPPLVVGPTYSTGEPGTARTAEPAPARTGQPVPQGAAAPEPIFYPRNGQSAEATESDRRECNRWATTQRGAMADASIFQRATFACMEGRGYTVR
jgi:hypothetical protein